MRVNSVDLDEVAHDEPSHQDLRCLQIHLFSSLVLKEQTQTISVSNKKLSGIPHREITKSRDPDKRWF